MKKVSFISFRIRLIKCAAKQSIPLIATSIIMINSIPLYAVGIGGYINGGIGNTWHREHNSSVDFIITAHSKTLTDYGIAASYGGGLLIDSNPDSEGILNYRCNIGFDRQNIFMGNEANMNRANFLNTFGLCLYSNDRVKLWMGPQIGLNYLWGSFDHRWFHTETDVDLLALIIWPLIPQFWMDVSARYRSRSIRLFGVNAGLSLGININIGERLTLTTSLDARAYIYTSSNRLSTFLQTDAYLTIGILCRI